MVVKLNTVRLNGASLNHASLNGVGERLRASAGGGGGEVIPPEEPDVPDVPVTYILTASASNGVVSASVNGNAVTLPYTANEGDLVVVEVTANDGYQFEGWSDGSTDNPRSITMTADVTLSATCVEQVVESKYIQFADPAVEAVLMANGVSSDGIGITMEDAAKVTSIGAWFGGNTEIVSFEELQYFTGLTSIGSGYDNTQGFQGCESLQYVTLPTSMTEIKGYAFSGTSSLVEIKGADNVAILGGNAFASSGIQKLKLPSVQTINGSFKGCTNLLLLECGEKLTSIAIYTFWQMTTGLTTFICRATTPPTLASNNNLNLCSAIYVPDASVEAYKTATNWSAYADRIHPLSEIEGSPYIEFEDPAVEAICVANWSSDGIGLTKEDAAAVTSLGSVFNRNSEIATFNELGKYFTGVTSLSNAVFYNATNLRNVDLDNVVTLGSEVFSGCTQLESVGSLGKVSSISGNSQFRETSIRELNAPLLPSIPGSMCNRCYSLVTVNCPSATSVGGAAFYGCSALLHVNLGNDLSVIEKEALMGCTALQDVIIRATTPPTLNAASAFANTNDCPIYVPDASVDAYKAADVWSTYADRIRPISEYWLENGMNETFSFAPSTTSDTSQIVNTGIKLFSDDIPTWTLRVNVSDFDFSKMPNLATALACADETGSPYAGIHIARYTNISVIKMDINPGHANIIHTATPPTIIIRRNGNILESSTDNGLTYTTRMDDIANIITNVTGRLATIPMIVGGYYDANGNVGRPFYGRVKVEFWKEIIDFA